MALSFRFFIDTTFQIEKQGAETIESPLLPGADILKAAACSCSNIGAGFFGPDSNKICLVRSPFVLHVEHLLFSVLGSFALLGWQKAAYGQRAIHNDWKIR